MIDLIETVLDEARLETKDINHIVLIGEYPFPALLEGIGNFFDNRIKPLMALNTMEAASIGAAIICDKLNCGEKFKEKKGMIVQKIKGLVESIKNGDDSSKNSAVRIIAENIDIYCRLEEFYLLTIDEISSILRFADEISFKTANTIVTRASNKYGKDVINILPLLNFSQDIEENEAKLILANIPCVPVFSAFSNSLNQVNRDFEKECADLRKLLEDEQEKRQELESNIRRYQKTIENIKEEIQIFE